MPLKKTVLPEYSLINRNCFEDTNFLFVQEANLAKQLIKDIIDSYEEADRRFTCNNVVGIIGGRGSGKTTLMASLTATLQQHTNDSTTIICSNDPIDPKTLPNSIGIAGLVLGKLYEQFLIAYSKPREPDKDSSLLMESFEKVNLLLSQMTTDKPRDAIANPSDLYEISQITTLRRLIGTLAEKLAEYCGIPNGAFLIAIDDFDLDSSNCYRMAIDMLTYLDVRHLIFVLAMDETIFREELQRARLAELANFGEASKAILESEHIEGAITLSSIYDSSIKYAAQLSDKFIPLSKRVTMQSGFILDANTSALVSEVYGHLYGDIEHQNNPAPTTQLTLFNRALRGCGDLRVRNQSINQIQRLLKANGDILDYGALKYAFAQLAAVCPTPVFKNYIGEHRSNNQLIYSPDRSFFQIAANQLELVEQSIIIFGEPCPWKMAFEGNNDIVVLSEEGAVRFSELAQKFLSEHPLGYFTYEYYVSRLDVESEFFIRRLVALLKAFAPGSAEYQPDLKKLRIGDKYFSPESVIRTFKRPDAQHLLNAISAFNKNGGRVTKRQLNAIISMATEYFSQFGSMPNNIERTLDELSAIKGRSWGDAEERSKRKEEARLWLTRLSRYVK